MISVIKECYSLSQMVLSEFVGHCFWDFDNFYYDWDVPRYTQVIFSDLVKNCRDQNIHNVAHSGSLVTDPNDRVATINIEKILAILD